MLTRLAPRPVAAVALALSLLVFSGSAHAEHPTPNLVELAQSRDDLSILVQAVQRAGLVETLAEGHFTVFAPDNDAFLDLLDTLGFDGLDDVPEDALAAILLDHVVGARVTAGSVLKLAILDRSIEAAGGLDLRFDIWPPTVNHVEFLDFNLWASNGIVHVISEVLLDDDIDMDMEPPPTLLEIVQTTESLSILAQVIERTGFGTMLQEGGAFTVFAPTNDAFIALLGELGAESLDDVDDGTLVNVLLDHIIARNLDSDALQRYRYVRAAGNFFLRIQRHPFRVAGNEVLIPDVPAANGIAHVIDGVIVDPNY